MDLQAFMDIEESKESIVKKLKYLKDNGLNDYLEYAVKEMGLKKLPAKKDDQIIQQIIAKTPNDLNKKVASKEYYKAHLFCIKRVLDEMFLHDDFIQNFEDHELEKDRDMAVYNYYNLLREILFDLVLFIQNYKTAIKKEELGKLSVGKNLFQRDFTLYQLLPQVIFGQVSFHSFIEREPFVSIAIIRQIIELRIRRAFGIMGVYDKDKDSFEPLALSLIFNEIKKYRSEIDFAVPLENIIRINGWSNIYLHSGMKDYTWTIIFVYRYLHKLIKGRKDGGSWSANSGIRLTEETLLKVRNGLEQMLQEKNLNLRLYKSKPDVKIIKK